MLENCDCGLRAIGNCIQCKKPICEEHRPLTGSGYSTYPNEDRGYCDTLATLEKAAFDTGYWSSSVSKLHCDNCRTRDGQKEVEKAKTVYEQTSDSFERIINLTIAGYFHAGILTLDDLPWFVGEWRKAAIEAGVPTVTIEDREVIRPAQPARFWGLVKAQRAMRRTVKKKGWIFPKAVASISVCDYGRSSSLVRNDAHIPLESTEGEGFAACTPLVFALQTAHKLAIARGLPWRQSPRYRFPSSVEVIPLDGD